MTPPSKTEQDTLHRAAIAVEAPQPEQLFRAIFEQAAVGVAVIETASGRFVRVNQRYCEIVGLKEDDMAATTFMAITHPDDLQTDLDRMEALKAGLIRSFSMEKRYFHRDGTIVWVSLTVSPMWRSGERPTFHIAVVQDITARKQAEQNLAYLNATLEQQVAERTFQLHQSRQQLQAIIEGTSDAVFIKDMQGRYLLFNAATCNFVGKAPEDVLGRDDTALFPPAEAKILMDNDRRTMFGGKTCTYEDNVTTADGTPRTFLSTKGPLVDRQGQVTGLFGISRDITDRKQAEDRLRRTQFATDQALDAIYWIDRSARILYVNEAASRMLGYSRCELLAMTVHDLNPDFQADMWPGFWAETRQRKTMDFETINRTKDGRLIPIEIRVIYLKHEGLEFHCAFVRDITQRKQAAETLAQLNATLEQRVVERTSELQERETQISSLLDHFPGCVARFDREYRYRYASPTYECWFGKKPLDVVGCTILEVMGREAFERAKPAVDRALGGERVTFEISIALASGATGHHLVTLEPDYEPDGSCYGCSLYAVDITARRQVEDALRASERFNKKAYARQRRLSRELHMATENERRRLSRELHDEFGQLLGALKFDVSRIAGDIEKVDRVTAAIVGKKLRVVRKTVDRLFSSLREMVRGLRPAVLDELGLVPSLEALATEVQEHSGLRCRVVADWEDIGKSLGPELESAIFRITQELLTNVVRHADARAVRVELSARDGWAQLAVRDDGRGMRREPPEGRRRFGLRGVRERAELLGGQVEILSGADDGTTVVVRIPYEPVIERPGVRMRQAVAGRRNRSKRV